MHPDMINIFNIVTVTKLSFYILVFGLVLSFIIIFTLNLSLGKNLLAGLLIFLGFCLESYNVNCVQLGNCRIWAYLLTILYIGYSSAMIFLLITRKIKPSDVLAYYTDTKFK